jgi:hypothetical protein
MNTNNTQKETRINCVRIDLANGFLLHDIEANMYHAYRNDKAYPINDVTSHYLGKYNFKRQAIQDIQCYYN